MMLTRMVLDCRGDPHPPPLPTRARGGAFSVGVGAGGARLGAPSPLWGGLGWGALGKGRKA